MRSTKELNTIATRAGINRETVGQETSLAIRAERAGKKDVAAAAAARALDAYARFPHMFETMTDKSRARLVAMASAA